MKRIIVLSNTILLQDNISGGDIIFPQISKHLKDCTIEVIGNYLTPQTWQLYNIKVKFHIYPPNFLDHFPTLLLAPLKYIINTINCIRLLFPHLKAYNGTILIYTSSDLFPDTIPTFLAKIFFPQIRWISAFYHVTPSPFKRRNNFFYSIFSYIAQRLGYVLIRWKADQLIVLRSSYNEILKIFKKKNVIAIDFGFDKSIIDNIHHSEKKFDAITVGTLSPYRGTDDVIEIWQKAVNHNSRLKLAIIGGCSNSTLRKYIKKIKNAGLSNNIILFGFIKSQLKVYSLIKSAKIYLDLRYEGGGSLPTLEAFALGIPAVCYQSKLYGSVLKGGFIDLPKGHKNQVSQTIMKLLNNSSHRLILADEAKKAAQKYTWEKIAEDFKNQIKL